jgi:hypothetical protein
MLLWYFGPYGIIFMTASVYRFLEDLRLERGNWLVCNGWRWWYYIFSSLPLSRSFSLSLSLSASSDEKDMSDLRRACVCWYFTRGFYCDHVCIPTVPAWVQPQNCRWNFRLKNEMLARSSLRFLQLSASAFLDKHSFPKKPNNSLCRAVSSGGRLLHILWGNSRSVQAVATFISSF